MAPIASGSLFHKVHKGYAQLIDVGLVEGELPAPVRRAGGGLRARRRGLGRGEHEVRPVRPERSPSRSPSARRPTAPTTSPSRHLTGGAIAAVPDDEIVAAIGLLARTTGIFTETAGGVTVATLARLAREGRLDPDASTVAYITGDGLKTPDAALSHVNPISIEADIDAVDAILDPVGVR